MKDKNINLRRINKKVTKCVGESRKLQEEYASIVKGMNDAWENIGKNESFHSDKFTEIIHNFKMLHCSAEDIVPRGSFVNLLMYRLADESLQGSDYSQFKQSISADTTYSLLHVDHSTLRVRDRKWPWRNVAMRFADKEKNKFEVWEEVKPITVEMMHFRITSSSKASVKKALSQAICAFKAKKEEGVYFIVVPEHRVYMLAELARDTEIPFTYEAYRITSMLNDIQNHEAIAEETSYMKHAFPYSPTGKSASQIIKETETKYSEHAFISFSPTREWVRVELPEPYTTKAVSYVFPLEEQDTLLEDYWKFFDRVPLRGSDKDQVVLQRALTTLKKTGSTSLEGGSVVAGIAGVLLTLAEVEAIATVIKNWFDHMASQIDSNYEPEYADEWISSFLQGVTEYSQDASMFMADKAVEASLNTVVLADNALDAATEMAVEQILENTWLVAEAGVEAAEAADILLKIAAGFTVGLAVYQLVKKIQCIFDKWRLMRLESQLKRCQTQNRLPP